MSTRKEEVTICDCCGKKVTDEGRMTYGGKSLLYGWISVTHRNFQQYPHSISQTQQFDFCSEACLRNHYKI